MLPVNRNHKKPPVFPGGKAVGGKFKKSENEVRNNLKYASQSEGVHQVSHPDYHNYRIKRSLLAL